MLVVRLLTAGRTRCQCRCRCGAGRVHLRVTDGRSQGVSLAHSVLLDMPTRRRSVNSECDSVTEGLRAACSIAAGVGVGNGWLGWGLQSQEQPPPSLPAPAMPPIAGNASIGLGCQLHFNSKMGAGCGPGCRAGCGPAPRPALGLGCIAMSQAIWRGHTVSNTDLRHHRGVWESCGALHMPV